MVDGLRGASKCLLLAYKVLAGANRILLMVLDIHILCFLVSVVECIWAEIQLFTTLKTMKLNSKSVIHSFVDSYCEGKFTGKEINYSFFHSNFHEFKVFNVYILLVSLVANKLLELVCGWLWWQSERQAIQMEWLAWDMSNLHVEVECIWAEK